MKIDTKTYNKAELRKRIGNIYQLGGTRHYELTEGSTKGTKAIDVVTGSGFNFTVVPDRGMDISLASYKGINLVYQTPNNEVNPAFYNPNGTEWLRTFFAGLLTTCGLTHIGPPGVDLGVDLGLHGRYSAISAKHVCDISRWDGDDYIIELSGTIEDSTLFGDKLIMTRTIKSKIGEKSLIIHDSVENYGSAPAPLAILYHINAGFPLLDGTAKFAASSSTVEPYDVESKKVMDQYGQFTAPIAGIGEYNFLHVMSSDSDGYAYALVENRELLNGIGLYLRFRADNLPFLSQWKMASEVDYVLGIEPCNTKCENRSILRSENLLPYLKPGEIRKMEVEIGVLDGSNEIETILSKMLSIIK